MMRVLKSSTHVLVDMKEGYFVFKEINTKSISNFDAALLYVRRAKYVLTGTCNVVILEAHGETEWKYTMKLSDATLARLSPLVVDEATYISELLAV